MQNWLLLLVAVGAVVSYPQLFQTQKFKVGIEYDHSLPMSGGSDRHRHRNNYDPFYVTLTATAKKGFVISYLEVSATTDVEGTMDFKLVRGQTGSQSVVFQLVSNNSDFLSYSYLAYGIREEEYRKIANIISVPVTNNAMKLNTHITLIFFILHYLFYIN